MKKFMKGCAITALILVVLGFVMAFVAGTIGGTKAVNEIVESVTDGKIHIDLGDSDGFGIYVDEEELFSIGDNVHYDITDNMMFDGNYEITRGEVEKQAVGSGMKNLDIEAGGCAFYFEDSEDSNFYIEAKGTGKFQCFVKGETLYVKTTKKAVDWEDDDCEIVLYIPADCSFEKIDIELGAGHLELDNLVTGEIDMEVGAGQVNVDYLQADKCSIEVGMGEILMNDMQVTKLGAEVGMGHLMLGGTIAGDVNAECAMGSIEMNLTGSKEDFNYTIESAVGNVSIANSDYSGLAQDKVIRNSADKNMILECAMGNIEVNFE